MTRMWADAQLDCRPRGAVSTIAVSSLDSLTRKTHHRVKLRVASCHAAEVIAIRTFTCPTRAPRETDLTRGWWHPTVFGVDVLG